MKERTFLHAAVWLLAGSVCVSLRCGDSTSPTRPESQSWTFDRLDEIRGDRTTVLGDPSHLQNWIDAIRSRKKPNTPAEEGVRACVGAHPGNLAFRTGQVARLENFQRGGFTA